MFLKAKNFFKNLFDCLKAKCFPKMLFEKENFEFRKNFQYLFEKRKEK